MPSWPEARAALYAWATEFAGCPAIWARTNGPQPNPPYVSLSVLAVEPLSGLHRRAPEADGYSLSSGEQTVVISAQAFGEGAMARVMALGASIERQAGIWMLDAANLVAVDALGAVDISALIGSEWQERASVDVRIRVPFSASDFVSWIESVELTGTVKDATGATAVNVTHIIEGTP